MAYDGSIKIDTAIDGAGFQAGLSKLSGLAKIAFAGILAGVLAVTTALAGGAIAAINLGSEYEAQMSRVQAISGATTEEFKALNEQAKQLGADTAFSASQAAQGMENLASAGFAVDEIIEAMPGMLDLAASSGEGLAASSDIAASTLRGFGLAASQAAHVADVLAKNSAQTNAAVMDTGYAMKYVAPVARTAGWSLEMTAAAIGELADAGIKGEQAGTTLRGALTRLMKPTKQMQETMDALGFSAYDSSGKMLPLSDIINGLNDSTKDLSEEQRNAAIATIFGTEALSGMQVLLAAGGDKLDEMTASLVNSTGAADKMASIMQDNLKGAVEQFKGSVETLGIELYESMDNPLKDVAQTATNYVNQLTEAFKKGGTEGLVKALGDILADAADKVGKKAPGVVKTVVTLIQSFVEGVKRNSYQLLAAAREIVNAIIDGLVALLPDSVKKPIADAVDSIQKSFESGGLRTAIQTVGNLIKGLGEIIGAVASVVLPILTGALDILGGKMDWLIPIVGGVYAGMKAFTAVEAIMSGLKTLGGAWEAAALQVALFAAANDGAVTASTISSAALTAKEVVVGALTGKIALATAAQWAWNTAVLANPIGAIVAAVAALAVGIGLLYIAFKNQKSVEEERLEVIKQEVEETYKLIDANDKARESFRDKNKGIEEDFKAESQLIGTIIELSKQENKSTVDKAKLAGYVDQLNKAVPNLNLAYNEQTDSLSENGTVMRAYLQLQRDQLDLQSRQERGIEIAKELLPLETQLSEQTSKRAEAQAKLADLEEKGINSGADYQGLIDQLNELNPAIQTTETSLSSLKTESETNALAMDGLAKRIAESNSVISQSEQAKTAALQAEKEKQAKQNEEEEERRKQVYDKYAADTQNFFSTITTDEAKTAKQLTDNLIANQNLVKGWVTNLGTLTKRGLDAGLIQALKDAGPQSAGTVKNLVDASDAEIKKLNEVFKNGSTEATNAMLAELGLPQVTNSGSDMIDKVADGVTNNDSVKNAAVAMVNEAKTAADKAVTDNNFDSVGLNMILGIVKGVKNNLYRLREAMVEMAETALKAAKERLEEASPSKAFEKEVGAFIPPGVDKGVNKAMPATLKNMKAQMSTLMNGARSAIASQQARVGAAFTANANYQLAVAAGPTPQQSVPAPSGDTIIINSPKALSPAETARQIRLTKRQIILGVK